MKELFKAFLAGVVFVVFVSQGLGQNSLTNGVVAYWGMDSTNNGIVPDLVNGFDLKPYGASGVTNFNGSNIQLIINGGPHFGSADWFVHGTNALSFNSIQGTLLGYISPGFPSLLPPTLLTNYTISFWVKGSNTGGNAGARVLGIGDSTGGNGLWDFSFDPNGTMQADHFVRQSASFADGVQYGNFNPNGQHSLTTNIPFADGQWHNIIITHQVVTNVNPVVLQTNVTPMAGKITLNWTATPLDGQFPNWTNQVDTNQNYVVQKSTDLSDPASWMTIGQLASTGNGTSISFTDNDATNASAFYRVIKPRTRYAIQTIYMDVTNVDCTMSMEPVLNNPPSANFLAPYGVWHQNTFAFGGYLRGSPGGFSTVQIGEAAIWDRVLDTNEMATFRLYGFWQIQVEPGTIH
jgi:hypothetical protein